LTSNSKGFALTLRSRIKWAHGRRDWKTAKLVGRKGKVAGDGPKVAGGVAKQLEAGKSSRRDAKQPGGRAK